eukprot:11331869-Prorocentrum_lima.AAC.1
MAGKTELKELNARVLPAACFGFCDLIPDGFWVYQAGNILLDVNVEVSGLAPHQFVVVKDMWDYFERHITTVRLLDASMYRPSFLHVEKEEGVVQGRHDDFWGEWPYIGPQLINVVVLFRPEFFDYPSENSKLERRPPPSLLLVREIDEMGPQLPHEKRGGDCGSSTTCLAKARS